MDEVYVGRIRRQGEAFSVKKLGAWTSDLAALSGFFDPPWTRPVSDIDDAAKPAVLGWAAFRLRALGRLREAAGPFEAEPPLREQQEDWTNAAIAANNLSELWLALGDGAKAVALAKTAVAHADKSGDAFEMQDERTAHADALHQVGRGDEAFDRFREAEAMQAERQPVYPRLYSFAGYRYCDLLLARGAAAEAGERAETTLEWAIQHQLLLDIALDTLTLGRACLAGVGGGMEEAFGHLDTAVDGLRRAGEQTFIPRGLVARAECHRRLGDEDKATRDLDESERLCRRSELRLLLADTLLERTRLHHACARPDAARTALAEAAALVDKCGYGRRAAEVAELRRVLEAEVE